LVAAANTFEFDENNALATLKKEWSEFTPSDQARCVLIQNGPTPYAYQTPGQSGGYGRTSGRA
jgi:hypothetical protein